MKPVLHVLTGCTAVGKTDWALRWAEEHEAEQRVFEEKAREEGKPDNVVEKIVQGQLNKWASEVALLDQTHVNTEKHDSKTIEELRQELAAKTGENIRIARFSYFRVGDE